MQLPYVQVPVRADGGCDQQSVSAAVQLATQAGVTDVLVLAHGWNETPGAAFRLYTALTDQLVTLLAQRPAITRRFAVVGIVWPSLKWADDVPLGAVAGGALALAPDDATLLHDAIRTGLEDPAVQDELQRLVPALETPQGRSAFVATLRRQLPPQGELSDDDALPSVLQHGDAEELFGAAEGAAPDALPPLDLDGSMAAGPELPDLGAGTAFHLRLSDLNPISIARQLVNLTSYYQMKNRAGKVGNGAAAQVLTAVHAADPRLDLHLAGHSFGGRVVAAAATASGRRAVPVRSLVLLQGAFSHLAFAPGTQSHPAGAFRGALEGAVTGPIVDTHTHHDLAVTVAYAVASRLARQSGDALGGADDPYGGIGANGAVDTPEAIDAVDLGEADARYTFSAGHIHNLRADRFVAGHSDIRGPQVANALLQAMLT